MVLSYVSLASRCEISEQEFLYKNCKLETTVVTLFQQLRFKVKKRNLPARHLTSKTLMLNTWNV